MLTATIAYQLKDGKETNTALSSVHVNDVSLLAFQPCGFEDGEGFQYGHGHSLV
jgi:hypothetical protein